MDKTVLVVEDNLANRKLVCDLLQLVGCRTVQVRTAEESFEVIENQDVDMILMDIQLPGIDGLTATKIIREDMGVKNLPILGISAMAMDADKTKSIEAGCNEYLTKPIDTRTFMKIVREYLSDERTSQSPDRRGPSKALERRRVLIADEDQKNVKLLKGMLPREKYAVFEAFSGSSALKEADAVLPDVVFLDVAMPDMSGYEATRRLKENSSTSHIPVVLITALEGEEDRILGIESGAEDVLLKPVNRVEMIARARSMVRLYDYRKQVHLRKQAAGIDLKEEADTGDSTGYGAPTILAVEDNISELNLLKAFLEQEPYQILTAETGREALTIMREEEIDIILLDLLLPDMEGWQVLESARKLKGQSTLQTVVITCLDDINSRIKGVELGVDDYLVKPVNARELRVRIKALLRKKIYMDQLKKGFAGDIDSTIKDPLTGLYKGDYFRRVMELELKRSTRHHYSTSIVKITVDELEPSSMQGKETKPEKWLLEVSTVLIDELRDIDLIARSDEMAFTVLLPYCDEEGALKVISRIRQAMMNMSSPFSDQLLEQSVSVNMGMVCFPAQAQNMDDLLMLLESGLETKRRSHGKTMPGGFYAQTSL